MAFFPKLSDIFNFDQFPTNLGNWNLNTTSFLDKLFYKNLQVNTSPENDAKFYSFEIITPDKLSLTPEGLPWELVINDSHTPNGTSEIKTTVGIHIPILKYLPKFNRSIFQWSSQDYYNILVALAEVTDQELLRSTVKSYYSSETAFEQFVDGFNNKRNPTSYLMLPTSSDDAVISALLQMPPKLMPTRRK